MHFSQTPTWLVKRSRVTFRSRMLGGTNDMLWIHGASCITVNQSKQVFVFVMSQVTRQAQLLMHLDDALGILWRLPRHSAGFKIWISLSQASVSNQLQTYFKSIQKQQKQTLCWPSRASTCRWKHGYLEVYVQICQLAAPSTARRCDCSIHLLQPWADACRCHHVTVDIMALVHRWISRWNGATLEHKFNLSSMWMGNDGDGLWCFNSSFFGQISVHSNIQHRCLGVGCALPPNRTGLSFAGANQLRTGWGLRGAASVPSPCAHGGCYGRTLFAASVLQDTTTLQPTLLHCGVIPQCPVLPKGTWPLQSE